MNFWGFWRGSPSPYSAFSFAPFCGPGPAYPWPSVGADPTPAPAMMAPMAPGLMPPDVLRRIGPFGPNGVTTRGDWVYAAPGGGVRVFFLDGGKTVGIGQKTYVRGRCWQKVGSIGWMSCDSVALRPVTVVTPTLGEPPPPFATPPPVPMSPGGYSIPYAQDVGLMLSYMRRLTDQAASDPFAVDPAQVDQLAQELTNAGYPDDAQQMSQLAVRLRFAQGAHPHKVAGVGAVSATFLPSSPAGLKKSTQLAPLGVPFGPRPFGTAHASPASPLGRRVPLPRPTASELGQGAAAARRAIALAVLHRRVATHQQIVAATARQQAVAAVAAQGITTPITCSTNPALHCPIYDVATDPATGRADLTAPIARVPGGATGLFADLAHPRQLSQGAALGLITVYRVAWVDAPGGAIVFGWMPDGGFGVPPGGRLPADYV